MALCDEHQVSLSPGFRRPTIVRDLIPSYVPPPVIVIIYPEALGGHDRLTDQTFEQGGRQTNTGHVVKSMPQCSIIVREDDNQIKNKIK